MKILHLLDWSNFVSLIVDTFQYYGLDSDAIICVTSSDEKIRAEKKFPMVEVVLLKSKRYDEITKCNLYDILWLHGFDWWKSKFVHDFKAPCKLIWSVFGGGYDYLLLLPEEPVYGANTLSVRDRRIGNVGIGRVYHKLRRFFAQRLRWHRYKVRRFLNSVDAFSLVMPTEEPILRRLIPNAICFEFLYTKFREPTELAVLPVFRETSRRRVWVGNSATLMNNHLDAIAALSVVKDQFDQLVLPYSYGHQSIVTKSDIEKVASSNGLSLKFLETEMPYSEYRDEMLNCSALVFAQYQQGGCGNVSLAFSLGLKVFLSERSPVYMYYKSKGYIVFTVEGDLPKENSLLPLTQKQREWNWRRFNQRAPWSVFPEKTKPFIQSLREEGDACNG